MESISPGTWVVEYEGGEYSPKYLGGRVGVWRAMFYYYYKMTVLY